MTAKPLNIVNGDEINLANLIRVGWTYKWMIAAVTLSAVGIAAYHAFTERPIYRAEVVVTDAREKNLPGTTGLAGQLGGIASLAGINVGGGNSISREARAVLQSRHLAEEFITRNKMGTDLGPVIGSNTSLWQSVRYFHTTVLHFEEDLRKGTITISVDWIDPNVAARWANEYVDLVNQIMRGRALDESNRNLAYLNSQMARTEVLEIRTAMYNLIESEMKTSMLANGRTDYAFTIVDPAVSPEIRKSPRRTLQLAVGLSFGFIFGLLGAIGYNWLRRQQVRNR